MLEIFIIQFKSMRNTAISIKNCKLFSQVLASTIKRKIAGHSTDIISALNRTIFLVVNASTCEKSCLQFLIPTWSGLGGEGGVTHSLNKL